MLELGRTSNAALVVAYHFLLIVAGGRFCLFQKLLFISLSKGKVYRWSVSLGLYQAMRTNVEDASHAPLICLPVFKRS
jgi:hypothetical protein